MNISVLPASVVSPTASQTKCQDCQNRLACLTKKLVGGDLRPLRSRIQRSLGVAKGSTLSHAGQPLRALFVIRSGSFKLVSVSPDGDEQIVGFRGPGEILGLIDTIGQRHALDTIALEPAEVWEVPWARAQQCLTHELHDEALSAMASRVRLERTQLWRRNHQDAVDRLGAFLLDLAEKNGTAKRGKLELLLSMSRADIGNFLGMKIETVSRSLGTMQQRGLITVRGRRIRLQQIDQLAKHCHWTAAEQC